ncbi:hypothetical protein M231_03838 [Tremella mesenterica]|uniref:Uncharacterized protein n=1 Tax=Tremella mesenterica TaxID=5217 RepID=A0A4Q1BM50_TREME|nr:uncharacterized protein TREMEDRAFT_58497 [Tremella mesenterica DSM 1558]EIW72334.1 hypothetical protein TREMEDRAFT_58497 [Tremella mesenterica DSM 1558]RXK38889.1 hypothetical protein M231_03838 [Tremella mesenterica]
MATTYGTCSFCGQSLNELPYGLKQNSNNIDISVHTLCAKPLLSAYPVYDDEQAPQTVELIPSRCAKGGTAHASTYSPNTCSVLISRTGENQSVPVVLAYCTEDEAKSVYERGEYLFYSPPMDRETATFNLWDYQGYLSGLHSARTKQTAAPSLPNYFKE